MTKCDCLQISERLFYANPETVWLMRKKFKKMKEKKMPQNKRNCGKGE